MSFSSIYFLSCILCPCILCLLARFDVHRQRWIKRDYLTLDLNHLSLYSWFDSWPSASRRRQNPIDMVVCSSSRLLLECNSNTILLSLHSKESAFRILLTQLLLQECKDLKDWLLLYHKSTLLLLRNALPGFLKILSSYVTADFRWRHLRFSFWFFCLMCFMFDVQITPQVEWQCAPSCHLLLMCSDLLMTAWSCLTPCYSF